MKRGLILINIGTPSDLTLKSVRSYLNKFLMDPFVIDIPYIFRWILVKLLIVPFRSKNTLKAYEEIWKKEGSPLEVYTKELVVESQKNLGDSWRVAYAMSYSLPSIEESLEEMKSLGVSEVFALPMYPQYAESSTRTSIERLKLWQSKNKDLKLKTLKYHFHLPSFLKASIDKIRPQILSKDVHYLFSFHGLPESHTKKVHPEVCKNTKSCCESWGGENEFCYKAQCIQTAKKMANELSLKNYSWSFQSRLGRAQWITPYTVNEVVRLAQDGVKDIVVIPYAFTIDCLETEEEIENEIKETFLNAGGESLTRVECLNKDFAKVFTDDFFKEFKEVNSIKL